MNEEREKAFEEYSKSTKSYWRQRGFLDGYSKAESVIANKLQELRDSGDPDNLWRVLDDYIDDLQERI